jgi:hypothetical protein
MVLGIVPGGKRRGSAPARPVLPTAQRSGVDVFPRPGLLSPEHRTRPACLEAEHAVSPVPAR